MRLYLLRHGESVDDIEDAYGGIADYPLTDSGRVTARTLAERLADSGISILYSSPYQRANETARILQTALACPLEILDDLRERNSYGVLSGVTKVKAKEIFGLVLNAIKGKPGDFYSNEIVPGAEPHGEFAERVKRAFQTILTRSKGCETVGVVTHGNVTRAIYKYILGVQGQVGLDLLAVSVLDCGPDGIGIERTEGVDIKQ
jgi:broad specificity phosphatase PhoE